MNINRIITNSEGWIEGISAKGVFEEKIELWIKIYEMWGLPIEKQDLLSVTEKVARYRGNPLLLEKIKQRLN
ncbi:MAG: hypothetical protein HYT94_03715 [Parcubacteria group bacterium]|nr:hypothetical protein [Parcubacteria group bacterium]